MKRKLETMFDIATIPTTAALLDSTELVDICIEQRTITMKRVAGWLRNNARIFELEWEGPVAKELNSLADDLDYLAAIKDV